MKVSVYIVDVTRAYRGSEVEILAEVRRRTGEKEQLTIIGRDGQRDALNAAFPKAQAVYLQGYPVDVQVADVVGENVLRAANSELGRCVVLSFHRNVLAKSGSLNQISHLFDVQSLQDYLPTRVAATENEWPEQLMPLDEALISLRKALQKAGATGPDRPVLKTDIRPFLVRVDERFDKDTHHLARTPRLISILLHEARKRGMIRQYGMDPQVKVALSASALPGSDLGSASHVLPAMPSSVNAPAPSTVAEFSTQGSGLLALPSASASEPLPADGGQSVSRSWNFVNYLRSKELGPYPEVRHLLYAEIARIVATDQELWTVRELARKAVAATKEQAPDEFPRPRSATALAKEKYDWRGLEKFAIRIIVRGGLALGPDSASLPINTSVWEARRAPVLRELPENLPVRLDAEIIMEIVEHFQDVAPEDIDHLAGALLAKRDEAARDHIDEAIFYLQDTGRVVGNGADDEPDVLLAVPQPEPFVHDMDTSGE
ncbi:hypothetical protein AB0N87_30025 [Streptomyces sp. NPDC093228]|uniref:hypothetical protein n=1 Tax=Streptomyces sp. NPDC093228 TaxID=3155070 RepID=UPI00341B23A0